MERRALFALAAMAALSFGAASFAQAPAEPQAVEVSQADLETFADIYVDLQDTASKYEAQMLEAETEDQARDLQVKMREESVAKVAERGWTPDRYILVAQAINADPALTERTRNLIIQRP